MQPQPGLRALARSPATRGGCRIALLKLAPGKVLPCVRERSNSHQQELWQPETAFREFTRRVWLATCSQRCFSCGSNDSLHAEVVGRYLPQQLLSLRTVRHCRMALPSMHECAVTRPLLAHYPVARLHNVDCTILERPPHEAKDITRCRLRQRFNERVEAAACAGSHGS